MRAAYTPLAIWQRLRSTYWFVPSLMSLAGVGLAVVMVIVDRRTGADWLTGWLYSGGADGARSLLSSVAGSTITVVSLTFSVTIVAVTVTSQHFGPRLLNNFMRDVSAQLVLGAFIGTFGYCVVVLRSVRGEGDGFTPFVPHLAVTVAVGLTLASVAALIYFIHHISASMQVATITTQISNDLRDAIHRLYPAELGTDHDEDPRGAVADQLLAPPDAGRVVADRAGYVQQIDADAVLKLARKHDVTIWLATSPGKFVLPGLPIASVVPAASVTTQLAATLNGIMLLGPDRTSTQDPAFAVQQLVEVALHALSPGMNEPFTAITCIDRLCEGLVLLASRRIPSPVRRDDAGALRVVAPARTFDGFLSEALTPITVYAGRNPAITARLLWTLEILAGATSRQTDRDAIRRQTEVVWREAGRQIDEPVHLATLEREYRGVLARLDG